MHKIKGREGGVGERRGNFSLWEVGGNKQRYFSHPFFSGIIFLGVIFNGQAGLCGCVF